MNRPEPLILMIALLGILVFSSGAQATGQKCNATVAVSGTDTVAGVMVIAIDAEVCSANAESKTLIERAHEAMRDARTLVRTVTHTAATVATVVARTALRMTASALVAMV